MTVGSMLRSMTASELQMWIAFFKVENEKLNGGSKDVPPPSDDSASNDDDDAFASNIKAHMQRSGARMRKIHKA